MVALGESFNAGTDGGHHARPFMTKDDRGAMSPLPLDHVQVAVTDPAATMATSTSPGSGGPGHLAHINRILRLSQNTAARTNGSPTPRIGHAQARM